MTWEVDVAPPAVRQLRRLSEAIAAAVVEFITGPLAENPTRLSKPLVGDFVSLRSARRGDYRILVEVDEATERVLVVRIAHREISYRPPAQADRDAGQGDTAKGLAVE